MQASKVDPDAGWFSVGQVQIDRRERPDALPRILAKVAGTRVEDRTAPRLQRPEADFVEFLGDRQHVVDTHARRQKALVTVAQNQLGNSERIGVCHVWCFPGVSLQRINAVDTD